MDPNSADHLAGQDAGFEPQRQSNWEFEIAGLPGADREIIKLAMVSGDIPKDTSEEVALPYGNTTRYVSGKVTYESFPLVCRDFVDQPVREALVNWRKQVFDPATEAIGLARDYKKEATLTLYGPDNTMERQCKLQGCWPLSGPGGALDHGSSDPVQIEISIRYDKADWIF